jgi:hypothetical protein
MQCRRSFETVFAASAELNSPPQFITAAPPAVAREDFSSVRRERCSPRGQDDGGMEVSEEWQPGDSGGRISNH